MCQLAVVFRGVIKFYSKIMENVMCVCVCVCVGVCADGAAWGWNRASQWRGDGADLASRLCALFLVLLLRLLLLLAGLAVMRVAVVLQLRSCLPLAHSAP